VTERTRGTRVGIVYESKGRAPMTARLHKQDKILRLASINHRTLLPSASGLLGCLRAQRLSYLTEHSSPAALPCLLL
jgi:hypothetical protein